MRARVLTARLIIDNARLVSLRANLVVEIGPTPAARLHLSSSGTYTPAMARFRTLSSCAGIVLLTHLDLGCGGTDGQGSSVSGSGETSADADADSGSGDISTATPSTDDDTTGTDTSTQTSSSATSTETDEGTSEASSSSESSSSETSSTDTDSSSDASTETSSSESDTSSASETTATGDSSSDESTTGNEEFRVSLRDARVVEGDADTTILKFQLDVEPADHPAFELQFSTAPGVADPRTDYQPRAETLMVAAGSGPVELEVSVWGDTLYEANEDLNLQVIAAGDAQILRGEAVGTIENDDAEIFGLDTRPSNSTCLAGPSPTGELGLENAFPDVSAWGAVGMRQMPGDDDTRIIAEKSGRLIIMRDGRKLEQPWLDISDRVRDQGEQGLLGFDIHPDHTTNGYVYVSYSASDGDTVIARFERLDSDRLDPDSEFEILRRDQPAGNHNGGEVIFGPDGMLYFGFGDGGSQNDPDHNGQNTSTWLSSILRLDVDGASPYAIPSDNPFADENCNESAGTGDACPETWAYGFRNPWRMSFDLETGELWVGDVGQLLWEEVDKVVAGGNYGWRCREGAHDFRPDDPECAGQTLIDPEFEYDHSDGNCAVTGGYVYRGSRVPELYGSYIFGDSCSGNIWAVRDGVGRKLDVPKTPMWTFAQDRDGEVYIMAGAISRFTSTANDGEGPAARLSQTGCFDSEDPSQPAPGLVPYQVTLPFWSDTATKDRWLALPDGQEITREDDGQWSFPPGSVLAKIMRVDGQPVETRLLMRHDEGNWAGYSYEWQTDGSDAQRLDAGKVVDLGSQDWIFPGPGECMRCHTGGDQRALGLEDEMLNRSWLYPQSGRLANQLDTLDHIGLFSNGFGQPGASLPELPALDDERFSLEQRARAWMHVNCANCHRPAGGTNVDMDLRWGRSLEQTRICEVLPVGDDLGITDALRLAPGQPERSLIVARSQLRDKMLQMPPIASHLVDQDGLAILDAWISDMADCEAR